MIHPVFPKPLMIFFHSMGQVADGNNFPDAQDQLVFSTLSPQEATGNIGPFGLLAQPGTQRPTGKQEGIANFV
jgi:hypothetical protein